MDDTTLSPELLSAIHTMKVHEVDHLPVVAAYCITKDGHRRVLETDVSLSEAEVHWRHFLTSLSERGHHGLKMIISDNHSGLEAAKKNVFPSVPWQRCQFHLQKKVPSYISKKSIETEAHNDIRNIFNMPSKEEAEVS